MLLALLLASACDALVAPARRRPGRVALRAASLEFSKYQGLGNDFLLVDNRDAAAPKATPAQAQRLCDRHFGVGADGVIFVMPGDAAHDFRMTIYNSDGSEPEMCGNGIRCLAAYLGELGAAILRLPLPPRLLPRRLLRSRRRLLLCAPRVGRGLLSRRVALGLL